MVVPVYDENAITPYGFRPWMTWILVASNVLIFLYLALLPEETVAILSFHFGLVPGVIAHAPGTEDFEPLIRPELTLLTYMFMHVTWLHLAANMLFLWVFGDNVEAATGHLRFLVLYVLSGIAGGLVHVVTDVDSLIPLVGASGAVAGVVGAYILLRPYAKVTMLVLGIVTFRMRAIWIITIWLAWQVANVLVPEMSGVTAYWSHLGGFVTGILVLLMLRRAGVPLFGRLRIAQSANSSAGES